MARPHKMLPAAFRNGTAIEDARKHAASSLEASSDLRSAISLAEQQLVVLLQTATSNSPKLLLATASKLKDLAAARSSLNSDARENIKALGDAGFMQAFMQAHAAIAHMLPDAGGPGPDVDPLEPSGAESDNDSGHTATLQAESFQVGLFPTPITAEDAAEGDSDE